MTGFDGAVDEPGIPSLFFVLMASRIYAINFYLTICERLLNGKLINIHHKLNRSYLYFLGL